MESTLTQLEMDAVFQLIQLSGNSSCDFQVFWVKINGEKENREESVGETSSSSLIVQEKALSEEALPRRRKKWRQIVDIYAKSQPLIKSTINRGQKRPWT
ncbi:hypothetical protein PHJA_000853900 [Phtheirospermum japonicum]|uniref:Uncharacterized protein n=1 Tax=Phtheirospermum japonicum TaxID=374723 RepID=A0A830BYI8_9LAMI|nr:hypothetical protein PHJA_000853900 [Phtheirospermum japonicum]